MEDDKKYKIYSGYETLKVEAPAPVVQSDPIPEITEDHVEAAYQELVHPSNIKQDGCPVCGSDRFGSYYDLANNRGGRLDLLRKILHAAFK